MRRSPSWRDPERVAHERAARIRNSAPDLRVLDGAPEVSLLVVPDVVVLLGRADEPPGNAVRLRAGEDFLPFAGSDEPADAPEDRGALAIVRHPDSLLPILGVGQLTGHTLLLHPLDELRPALVAKALVHRDHVHPVGCRQLDVRPPPRG